MHFKCLSCLIICLLIHWPVVIVRAGDQCELRRVMHEFELPGCVRKLVPSYGCQGSCSSYVQVSNSKFWELERSCTCCQDMGQKERTVTVECPGRPIKEMRVVIRAPLSCICRQCTDVNEKMVTPQEFKDYLDYYKKPLQESIAFL